MTIGDEPQETRHSAANNREAVERAILYPHLEEELVWLSETQERVVGDILAEKSYRFWFGAASVGLLLWVLWNGFETGAGASQNPLILVATMAFAIGLIAVSLYSTFSIWRSKALLRRVEDRLVSMENRHFGDTSLGNLRRTRI